MNQRKKTKVIRCRSSRVELDGDYGRTVQGIQVECGECGHTTSSFGTSERSENRCLVLLKQECDCGSYYTLDDEGSSADQQPTIHDMYRANQAR